MTSIMNGAKTWAAECIGLIDSPRGKTNHERAPRRKRSAKLKRGYRSNNQAIIRTVHVFSQIAV